MVFPPLPFALPRGAAAGSALYFVDAEGWGGPPGPGFFGFFFFSVLRPGPNGLQFLVILAIPGPKVSDVLCCSPIG